MHVIPVHQSHAALPLLLDAKPKSSFYQTFRFSPAGSYWVHHELSAGRADMLAAASSLSSLACVEPVGVWRSWQPLGKKEFLGKPEFFMAPPPIARLHERHHF
ncbi:hypothetical protein BH10PSE16_BH10PSE16_35860 [soil metagenome]